MADTAPDTASEARPAGEALHGFVPLRERDIPELHARARHYRHEATGAELIAILTDETNKTFAASFPTLPEDDTGVAHILEHIVLAGSRKYPLKDPFFEMIKGSVASFLNAFTSPDKTTYPFASENEADFLNLLDVYLDAVFHPRLSPETFAQEAWHVELEDAAGPLSYRGVVFNEMKGAVADPNRALYRASTAGLFPDTIYRHESGGDPEAIPELTHQGLIDFHRRHYHPSNARFVLHGSVPLEAAMERLDGVLSEFERAEPAPAVEPQAPFEAPRRIEEAYPAGEDGKAFASVGWALPDAADLAEEYALDVLEHALIGTPAAPLRRALVESGLGEAFTGGLSGSLRQHTFSAGLRGVDPERADEVAPLVLSTLERVAEEGLDPGDVEAARTTLEFALRELDVYGGQRGIALAMGAFTRWQHGGDPFEALAFEAPLAELGRRLETDPRHLEGLLRARLLDNPHRLEVVVRPDREWLARRDAAERERLDAVFAAMGDAERERIVAATRALRAHQQAPDPAEALATLPTLGRGDLEREARELPAESVDLAGATGRYHPQPTNGIVYVDAGFDLRALPDRLVPYAGLLGRLLLETGTAGRDLAELTRAIGRDTGGIHPSLLFAPGAPGTTGPARLFLRGRALAHQAEALVGLMREVLLEPRLDDRERVRRIVLEDKARREASLVPSGHAVALRRLAAHATDAGALEERALGLAGLEFARELAERIESDWDGVAADLAEARAALATRGGLALGVTADPDTWRASRSAVEAFAAALPPGSDGGSGERPAHERPALAPREAFTLPAQVQYVGRGLLLGDGSEPLPGHALVGARHLSSGYLLPKIRLQGGAYGAGAVLDRLAGTLSFYSYRDPNLLATLDAYEGSARELREADLSPSELDRLVVGAAGKLEPYALPGALGFRALARWLSGVTPEMRQRTRDELLATERRHLNELADRIDAAAQSERLAVLGGEEAIEAARREKGEGWIEVRKAL